MKTHLAGNPVQGIPNNARPMPAVVVATVPSVTVRRGDLGWLSGFALLSGVVMLALATAATANRFDAEWAHPLFWVALCVMFITAAWRLLSTQPTRQERIGIVVLVGLTCYAVKILSYPSHFSYFDEFLHWQTTNDILNTRHLFTTNPLLPVSPLYPGLELVTSAMVRFTGLGVSEAGMILIGVARVILMISLYMLFEEISRSPRIAGLAALLYTCHTNYLFFSSEFSYESLALPLATFALFVIARRAHRRDFRIDRLIILIGLVVACVAITHHLTGYAIAAVIILWTFITFVRFRGMRGWLDLALIAACVLLLTGGWTAYVGNATVDYLGPVIHGGMAELMAFITGEATGRQLFHTSSGIASPMWERITAIMGVGFIMLMLPVGLFYIWRRYRNQTLALTLGCLVVLYPLMQAFRLTTHGWELASRSAAFLFWGISFVLAVGFVNLLSGRSWLNNRATHILAGVYITVIFVGGALSGWPGWSRLPGSYIVSGDPRAIEPQSITAATWVGANLPANSRIGADRVNMLLMAIWGKQRPVTHLSDGIDISNIYFAKQIGDKERALLKSVDARYLVVDARLSTALPIMGTYFESTENNGKPHTAPLDLKALLKFGDMVGVDRIYDSSDIKIYDVNRISHAP